MIQSDIVPLQQPSRLPPPTTLTRHYHWPYLVGITAMHLLALLACIPWLFSWVGVLTAFAGLYVFGTLGINLCYHRLLTHRGFECPRWLEHALAILGVCCLQDTPARWVGIHRLHHQHSDEQPDPHSPWVTAFWGHMGWLMIDNRATQRMTLYDRYARDLLRDSFYMRLERGWLWVWIAALQLPIFFGAGYLIGWWSEGDSAAGVQLGLSLLVWGVFLRTVLVWHITWSVNSVTHLWGYRNYNTAENSRNNILIGLVSNGEGWHNNHHAQPRSAAHGHRWWELDVTYWTICLLAAVGLARKVVVPRRVNLNEPAAIPEME